MPDLKGLAASIVAKEKPEKAALPGEDVDEAAEDGEHQQGLTDAADEMLAAQRSGDAAGFRDALKSFVRMCRYE